MTNVYQFGIGISIARYVFGCGTWHDGKITATACWKVQVLLIDNRYLLPGTGIPVGTGNTLFLTNYKSVPVLQSKQDTTMKSFALLVGLLGTVTSSIPKPQVTVS